MTATISLSDEEFRDLQELTKVNDASDAVRSAVDEYRRYARRMRLKEISGQVQIRDNWRELESAETKATRPR